jgi:stearoyl-CoA desaturase (delta-9 desaturase)
VKAYREELRKLRSRDARVLKDLKRWLQKDEQSLPESKRAQLAQTLARHSALHTLYTMRKELTALWDRSTASSEQLVRQLQDWCQRAEASGIRPLQEFASRLRSYA